MAMEFMYTLMELNIKDNGKMTNSMVKEFNNGSMDSIMKANIKMELNLEKGF